MSGMHKRLPRQGAIPISQKEVSPTMHVGEQGCGYKSPPPPVQIQTEPSKSHQSAFPRLSVANRGLTRQQDALVRQRSLYQAIVRRGKKKRLKKSKYTCVYISPFCRSRVRPWTIMDVQYMSQLRYHGELQNLSHLVSLSIYNNKQLGNSFGIVQSKTKTETA